MKSIYALILLSFFCSCNKNGYVYKEKNIRYLDDNTIIISIQKITAKNIIFITLTNKTKNDFEIEDPGHFNNIKIILKSIITEKEIPYYRLIDFNYASSKKRILLKADGSYVTPINVSLNKLYNLKDDYFKDRRFLLYVKYDGLIFKNGKIFGRGNIMSPHAYFDNE